eukprot:TRINITY_DN2107_c0_g1_i1.p1 TRINITY_DN2107_c0_g1~~TRINITY_DN2107_c0_g1_i1.p1  ORF type:complete len:204 (+),score=24.12 TRINITY_DN2107_c0_g1_i1:105-716(+)
MPTLEQYDVKLLCKGFAEELIREAIEGHSHENYEGDRSVFDSEAEEVPMVGIYEYLKRWVRWGRVGGEVIVAARMYLKRCSIKKTPVNVYRLLFVSLLVAVKQLDDQCRSNMYYSDLFCTPLPITNTMEAVFLTDLDFRLSIDPQEFVVAASQLLSLASAPDLKKTPGPPVALGHSQIPMILLTTVVTATISCYTTGLMNVLL